MVIPFTWLWAPFSYSGHRERSDLCAHKPCSPFPSFISGFTATLEDSYHKRSWLQGRMKLRTGPGTVSVIPRETQQQRLCNSSAKGLWRQYRNRTLNACLKLDAINPTLVEQARGSYITSQWRPNKLCMPTKCFFQMKMKPDDRGEKESFTCGLHPTLTMKRCLS